jgi:hypothetical protein
MTVGSDLPKLVLEAMYDPHVEALTYRFIAHPDILFTNTTPQDWTTTAFIARLEDGILTVTPSQHFADPDQARSVIESGLRAWEIYAGLNLGGVEAFRFEYQSARVIDRDPPSDEPEARVTHVTSIAADARLVRNESEYPQPPGGFATSFEVETMWGRWWGYRQGREPLAAMAYFCLTVLEKNVGGDGRAARQGIASRYEVDKRVLDKLGDLTGDVGDLSGGARKAHLKESRPHTDAELGWIEEVIQALIRRAGEYAADSNAQRTRLTMDDFPAL